MTGIIYCAENNINHKVYIGQTIKTMNTRKNAHIKNENDYHFHRALKKYNDWNWYIVQEYKCSKSKITAILNKAEKYYIDKYDSFENGYNMTKGGKSILGFIHSEETKVRMSNVHKGKKQKPMSEEHKKILSKVNKGNKNALGFKHTEEAKQKIRASRVGKATWNKGRTGIYSEETKSKMSVAAKRRWVKQEDISCRI